MEESDRLLALMLDSQFKENQDVASLIPEHKSTPTKSTGLSIIAPEWEDLDPTPDLQSMFVQFNQRFFWGKLAACEVRWSPRMTLCAGLCSYSPRQGYCSIRLSVPLLKLRPRKDFVETLLHEMIHAYLFVTDGNDDHDGHGPAFHKHMYRINKETGTNISVYHTFHDEVALYKQHWWKCNGPCVGRKPFFGLVKRSMNRAPGPNDTWWKDHQRACGGVFAKIKEPEGYGQKKKKTAKGQKDIRAFGKSKQNVNNSVSKSPVSQRSGAPLQGKVNNIFGFGGTSYASPSTSVSGLQTKGVSGSYVVNPGWKSRDNSFSGQVIKSSNVTATSASSTGWKSRDNSSNGQVINSSNATATSASSTGWKGNSSASVTAVNLNDSCHKVRQQTRDFWTKKFSQTNDAKTPAQNKIITLGDDEEQKADCPICQNKFALSLINSHLDECLTMSSLKNDAPSTKTCKKRQNPFVDDDDDDFV